LQDIPEKVDLLDIVRRSDAVQPIVEGSIAIGAGAIWMQRGVINTAAATLAEAAGLQEVMDRCPAIDIPRFKAQGLMF
jgi:predicted CoA-binding protein